MPYNSYFPASYQPYYQYQNGYVQPNQPQMQQAAQPNPPPANQPMNSSIIWVQGEAGAKSYLVAPNTTVQLWDSERQTIYLKSADASGMPSIKTLDYTIRELPQNSVSLASNASSGAFATKDEVNVLAEQIAALKGKIEAITSKPASKAKKDVVSDESAV